MRHPVQKRRLPTDKKFNVLEGERRLARKVREYYRRQGFEALRDQKRQFQEAAASHRWEAERLRQTETATVSMQTISEINGFSFRLETNGAAKFDVRQRIYLFEFSVESAQALEAQREVLTREAAEEMNRRDSTSLGMMQTLEFDLQCEASARREGFEQLQRTSNASNEECRKHYVRSSKQDLELIRLTNDSNSQLK